MDARFDTPLFTPAQAADYLWVSRGRFRGWLGQPVTQVPERFGLSIPFIGLLEGYIVKQLRDAGVQLREIREANRALREGLGVAHPLVWQDLAHNGRDILLHLEADWERARDHQKGFKGIVELDLQRAITWGADKYPQQLRLQDDGCEIILDYRLSGGHPIHEGSGVRVEDVLNLVKAEGGNIAVAAEEFGIPTEEVEALARADARRHSRPAA